MNPEFRRKLLRSGVNPDAKRLPFDAWRRHFWRLSAYNHFTPTTERIHYFSGYIPWSFFTTQNIYSLQKAGCWLLTQTNCRFLYGQLESSPGGLLHFQFVIYHANPQRQIRVKGVKPWSIKPIYSYPLTKPILCKRSPLATLQATTRSEGGSFPRPKTPLQYHIWYAGKFFTRVLGPFSWGHPPKSLPKLLQYPAETYSYPCKVSIFFFLFFHPPN